MPRRSPVSDADPDSNPANVWYPASGPTELGISPPVDYGHHDV
jgi:hypothetical protein